jgi:hypothetical protein
MKDILRQSTFYYIAVPVALLLWPLLLWLAYLPHTADTWQDQKKIYTEANEIATQILTLDPERLVYGTQKKKTGFDYTSAIDAAARKLRISSSNYTISSKQIRRSEGRQTQDCQIIINEINITTLAEFLSNLQVTWTNLQCQKITLTKKQGFKDAWKVDLSLKYYY